MAYYQWRALVGPRYNHFSWWTLNYGSTTPNLIDQKSVLGTNITNPAATTIALSNASLLPSAAGVWIGGSFSHVYEYVQYTGKSGNNLTGCVREPTGGNNHNGLHESDEIAYVWFPIDDDDGNLRFSLNMDAGMAAINWEGAIRGYKARHWALRNNHLIVIQVREGAVDSWKIEMVGVIDSPDFRDDTERIAPWSVRIRSMESIWAAEEVKGIRIGNLDIANGASAAGTTPLVMAFDERDSGDYTAAYPSFDAAQVVDGDDGTLWIAEKFMGTEMTYTFPNSDGEQQWGLRFNQLYINPPPGTPAGAKWIELVLLTGSFSGYTIYARDGQSANYPWTLSGTSVDTPGLIILCEDQVIFEKLNPLASPAVIRQNADFFARVLPAGGDIWLRLPAIDQWQNRIAWGNGAGTGNFPHEDAPSGRFDSGNLLDAPGVGQTMRYIHDADGGTVSRNYWNIGKVKHAGYKIKTTPDEWVTITLPGMDLRLKGDITASVPGNGGFLEIVDSAGNPSTAGLWPTDGTIQIGDERINYASKHETGLTLAASGARGAGGTTAAAHDEGDPVYTVDGGVVSNAHALKSIAWRRFGGTIYPSHFTVRTSPHLEPRTPGDSNWQNDYTTIASPSGATASSWEHDFSGPTRVQTIVVQIERMTTNPARPRLNEVEAVIDPILYLSSNWLDNGVNTHELIETILVRGGFPAAAISVTGGTSQLSNLETGVEAMWGLVADVAEFTGVRVVVGRDSKINIAADTFWTGTPAHSHTWDETNISGIEKADRNDLKVSQVKLKWRSPDGSESGEEVYPASPGIIGAVLETEELIYASSSAAQAAARKRFYLAHYPYTVVIEAADSHPTMKPGEVHRVQWSWNRQDGVIERLYLVTAVDHWIEDAHWYTTVYLQQIERVLGY